MKAFVIDGYGGPERMHPGDLPDPSPCKGEVVVDVVASSVNPVDWKIRAGQLRLISGSRFPRALGTEFAGVVHALGAGVTGFAVGDPVYGLSVTAMGRPGAHAERLAVPASALRRKPKDLPFVEAAVLPVAALTALNGLRLCRDLAGKAVLVNGATGGVGHFAVQIAKARGASRVAAVCSAAKADFARGLGADVVFDYRTDGLARSGERFDVVYDAFGHLGFGAACRLMAPRGAYVTPLGLPVTFLRSLWQNLVGRRRLIIGNVRTEPEDYAALEAMYVEGTLRPRIDRVGCAGGGLPHRPATGASRRSSRRQALLLRPGASRIVDGSAQEAFDAEPGRPFLEIAAIKIRRVHTQNLHDVSPLVRRHFPALPIPEQLAQHRVLGALDEQPLPFAHVERPAALELALVELSGRALEEINLHDERQEVDVPGAATADRVGERLNVDLEVRAQRLRERGDLKRACVDDHVDVVRRPGLALRGRGERASQKIRDSDRLQRSGDPKRDLDRVGRFRLRHREPREVREGPPPGRRAARTAAPSARPRSRSDDAPADPPSPFGAPRR